MSAGDQADAGGCAAEMREPSAPPGQPTDPKRIPVFSPRFRRRAWWPVLLGGVLIGTILIPGELVFEQWTGGIYACLAVVVSSALLWLMQRHALSTTVALDRDALRLERGSRTLWAMGIAEIAGWWCELGPRDQLRAIMLRSTHGELRRIDVSWMALRSEHYEHLLCELRQLRGVAEVPPVRVGRTLGNVAYILLLLIPAIIFLIVMVDLAVKGLP